MLPHGTELVIRSSGEYRLLYLTPPKVFKMAATLRVGKIHNSHALLSYKVEKFDFADIFCTKSLK